MVKRVKQERETLVQDLQARDKSAAIPAKEPSQDCIIASLYLSQSSQRLRVFLYKFLSLRSVGRTPWRHGMLDKTETLRVDHGIVDEHTNFKMIGSTKKGLIVLSDFSSQKIRQRKIISVFFVRSSDSRYIREERARDMLAQ